jgi:hypothetical protein
MIYGGGVLIEDDRIALITLAMGTRGPGFCTPEVAWHDWELARDVGAPISVHVGMGPYAADSRWSRSWVQSARHAAGCKHYPRVQSE